MVDKNNLPDIADIGVKAVERTIEIVHPATKQNIGVRVSLMSIADERMKKARRAITDRRLHLEARGKNFKAEELDENLMNLSFDTMTGWEWYGLTFNKTVPAFDRVHVLAVFRQYPIFLDQVQDALSDEAAFFTKPNTI